MKMRLMVALALLAFTASLISARPTAAAAAAEIQNTAIWKDDVGYFHVFGEVKNTGDVWLEFVKITGTFRDPNGVIVDVIFTYTRVDKVPPGSAAPFDLVETDINKANQIETYSLLLDFRETIEVPVKLVVLNVADSKNSLGWLEVLGEVQNQGDVPSTFTKIVATFRNAGGQVVYVHFTYADPDTVPAGATHPFKLTVLSDERSGIIATYDIIAEGHEYTSVPEWPTSALAAAAGLFIAVLALHRRRERPRPSGEA
jgi:hypothetical protein